MRPLLLKSYLATINNAIGSKQYSSLYVKENETGEIKDVLQDGNLSCAVFVSSVLHQYSSIAKLIDGPHATVNTTIKKMIENGWKEIDSVIPGAILRWESGFGEDGMHGHVGFAVSKSEAVSTSSKEKCVTKHHVTYDNTRNITTIYWHDSLTD